ncbi:MAG TPA: ABC transporter permease [Longimicrobiaceae bacterium]|nr:ABC transporter permease [Longimicrobiaceae bacterium]
MRPGISLIDFKLGLRMLVRYPGLTLVGGLAIAFAIWIGAGTFEFVTQVLHPTLPLDEGHRVVGIRNWDAAANRVERRALHDFAAWREELRTVEDLGAFRTVERNLITGEGRAEPVEMAEISASAFRLARVPPLLGRALVEEDERPGAAPVAVVGHDLWRTRFGGDPAVVGRTVRLGNSPATVVGVMPPGFAFPVSHGLWVPLRLSPLDHPRRQGPAIQVFGRLAPGATLAGARAELAALGQRTAADFPDTHRHIRPEVLPYARSILNLSGLDTLGIASTNLFLVMLLVLVCGNVALLMFARAATRENEIVVRNALGASRGSIVAQLFAEALVLAGFAAAVGLAAAGFGLRWGFGVVEAEVLDGGRLPFWFHATLSPATVLYAGVLTVLAALIAGVVPALKVTRGLGTRLRQVTAGGGGFRFGGVWTAVIIAQVAVTVAFPMTAYFTRRDAVEIRSLDVGFPEEEYLAARLEMDLETPSGVPADTSRAAFAGRFSAVVRELERRLEAEPGVSGVTFAERLPRMFHPHRRIEVDGGGAAPVDPRFGYRRVSSASVAPDYFDVLGAPVLAGRGFTSGDLASGAPVVVVNQSYVDRVLGGRNPVGRRVRYLHFEEWDEERPADDQPWYEIVGVVRDMGMASEWDPKSAGIYHPAAPGGAGPVHLAVHVKGDPGSFVPRLRAVASGVDPTLRLHELIPLERISQAELQFLEFWFWLTVVVSSVALLLSLTGIFAVMSFTVSQRTREIGIRAALGADRRGIVAAIFRRPLVQVSLGILAGMCVTVPLVFSASGGVVSAGGVALVALYAVLMMAVCMLACIVPTRRALGVEPTEALRADV